MNEWLMFKSNITLIVINSLSNNDSNSNRSNNKNQEIRSVELRVCPVQLFFIFDHVTFIQFKICCCVQNFMKIRWFFAELWRYNDFQNGVRPPSWNRFTTIRDHPRSLCCWPQLSVKFHVNLIHRSEDIAIIIFRVFGLKCVLGPKMRVLGDYGPLSVTIHHLDPNRHILA